MLKDKKINIAILGTRGIPANYGGFETFAENLSQLLAKDGHKVTVHCRKSFFSKLKEKKYQGINLLYLPTIYNKYLETVLHSLFSYIYILFSKNRPDVVLICNAANSPFAFILKWVKIPFAINVDGIERYRSKWNVLGKLWYLLGEKCAVNFADKIIADAQVIYNYYKNNYGINPVVIEYGAYAPKAKSNILEEYNLQPKNYLLYVSRLEPENNALGVIEAYKKSKLKMPLVIVGDAPYATKYKNLLYQMAKGHNIIFTGFRFKEPYWTLQQNCYAYIQATEVGGTHPALVEAMAFGNCVIANGTPENIEVLDNTGLIYQKNNFNQLAEIMNLVVNNPDLAQKKGRLAKARANKVYNWNLIKDKYLNLFFSLIQKNQE